MKHKKLLVGFIAAILAAISAFAFSACGGKTDWSKASWTDYDPEEFLNKTDIEYSLGEYEDSMAGDAYAFLAPTHLMLYKDGSAAAASAFMAKGAFGDIGKCGLPVYDDLGVLSMSYGYWTQEGTTIKITLNLLYLADYYDVENNGAPKEGVDIADCLHEYEYEAELVDGVITLPVFQSWKDTGAVTFGVQTMDVTKYATLKAWLESIPAADPDSGWGK